MFHALRSGHDVRLTIAYLTNGRAHASADRTAAPPSHSSDIFTPVQQVRRNHSNTVALSMLRSAHCKFTVALLSILLYYRPGYVRLQFGIQGRRRPSEAARCVLYQLLAANI